jgi:molybdopterin-guanine dinucleotide biosynthesis protein A
VLAGGAATRLGGSKAKVELAGRPLIAYPLAAFAAARIEAVVIAKPGTELPPLDATVVTEPDEPTHPLLGFVTALEHAGGRPVVTCPCDTPFVTADLITQLAGATGTAAVYDGERLHPLIARLEPADAEPLRDALREYRSATASIEALHPTLIRVDEREVVNVNTPDDLARAESLILPS